MTAGLLVLVVGAGLLQGPSQPIERDGRPAGAPLDNLLEGIRLLRPPR